MPITLRHGRSGGGEFGDEGLEEVLGGGAGGGELRFQLVHQGHQLIHFGHDPALFGEGWEREGNCSSTPPDDLRLRHLGRVLELFVLRRYGSSEHRKCRPKCRSTTRDASRELPSIDNGEWTSIIARRTSPRSAECLIDKDSRSFDARRSK